MIPLLELLASLNIPPTTVHKIVEAAATLAVDAYEEGYENGKGTVI